MLQAVEQRKKLCHEVETVEITYLSHMVRAGGGEAAMTTRTRCTCIKFRECSKLLYGKKFPLKLKGLYTRVVQAKQLYMKIVPERKATLQFHK